MANAPFPPSMSPGRKAAGRGPEEAKPEGVSVDKALSVLEAKINTSRGHAALKTLRSELSDGGGSKKDDSSSPGREAAKRFGITK